MVVGAVYCMVQMRGAEVAHGLAQLTVWNGRGQGVATVRGAVVVLAAQGEGAGLGGDLVLTRRLSWWY